MRMRNGLRSCMRMLSSSPPRALPCKIPTIAWTHRHTHTHLSITVEITKYVLQSYFWHSRGHIHLLLLFCLFLFHPISYVRWAPFHFCVCFTLRLPHNRQKPGTDGLRSTNILPMDRAPIIISEQMAANKKQDKYIKKMFQKQNFPSRSLCVPLIPTPGVPELITCQESKGSFERDRTDNTSVSVCESLWENWELSSKDRLLGIGEESRTYMQTPERIWEVGEKD